MPDRDSYRVAAVTAASLAYLAAVAAGIAWVAGIPLPALSLFFDGHLYLEIAKSFPLPYGPGALDYSGYAAGYPAFAYGTKVFLPDTLGGWGGAMLLASWLPAALSTGAFWLLCRELGVPALGGALLFLLANPRWVAVSATAHSEPLAMLLVLLALLAHFRGRVLACAVLITLAGFARHPAVMLIAPIGADLLLRRERNRKLLYLTLPVAGQVLVHVYLTARVPGFESVPETLRLFWQPELTWPFAAFFEFPWGRRIPYDWFLSEVTLASAVFYVLAILAGLRPAERAFRVLPMWVALDVLAHVSMSGGTGVLVFTRLVLLAWPAALLIALRLARDVVPPRTLVAAAIALGVFSTTFAVRYPALVVPWQSRFLPQTIAKRIDSIDHPEPRWESFSR